MQTQFPDWINKLRQDGQGGTILPAVTRGEEYELIVNFQEDVTGNTYTGSVRLSPDAAGSALATFTVSMGSFDGTETPVTFTLADSVAWPEDTDNNGLAETVFSIRENGDRLWAGSLPVSGEV